MISNRIRACNGLDRFIEAELKTLNESMDNNQIDSDESGVGPDGLYHTYEAVDFSGAGYDFDTIQEAQMFADETNNVSEIKEWSFDNPKKLKPVSSKVVWEFSETNNIEESIDNSACIEKKLEDSDEDSLTDQEKEFLDFKKDKPLKESAYTYSGHDVSDDLQQFTVTVVIGGTDGDGESGMTTPISYNVVVSAMGEGDAKSQVEQSLSPEEGITDVHLSTEEEISDYYAETGYSDFASDYIAEGSLTETISDAFKNKEYVVAFEDREGVHKKAFRTEQEAKKYASRLREEGEENIKIGIAKYGQTHANNQFQKRMDDRDAHNQEVADAEREEQHAKASVKHTGSKVRDYSSFTRGKNDDVDEYSNAKRNYQQKHTQANELKKKGFDDSKYDTKMPGFFKRLKNKSNDFKGEALNEGFNDTQCIKYLNDVNDYLDSHPYDFSKVDDPEDIADEVCYNVFDCDYHDCSSEMSYAVFSAIQYRMGEENNNYYYLDESIKHTSKSLTEDWTLPEPHIKFVSPEYGSWEVVGYWYPDFELKPLDKKAEAHVPGGPSAWGEGCPWVHYIRLESEEFDIILPDGSVEHHDKYAPVYWKPLKKGNKSPEALDEQLLKEARNQFCVELYLDTQDDPERIEFETYTEARSFAEEQVNDIYEAIYILQYGVNGPSEIIRWEKGYGWTDPLPGFETPSNESLKEAEEDNNIIKTAKAKLGIKESLLNEGTEETISADSLEYDLKEWFRKEGLTVGEVTVDEDEVGPGSYGYLITWEIDWGDWKHEHLKSKALFQKFCEYNNLPGEYVDEEVTEEDGSDTYSATHTAFIEVFDDAEENLDESFDAPVREKANKLYRRIANIGDDVVITESNLNDWAYKRAAVTLNCSFDRMKDYLGVIQ